MESYNKDDYKKDYDPELVVDATPAVEDGPPIPPGHSRFYCETCRVVSYCVLQSLIDLPIEHESCERREYVLL